ncbi:MAG: hypothetical protein KGJ02_01085 [Verrucomicrobiota bacterium]|nr:hypothetical protein [Verrucomicrobiota bacterium]
MRSLLVRLFVENWQRKLASLILAMIIWMVVNHSMTVTKTVHNIPVRVINLLPEKTIEGMQANGILNKKVSLTITGNKLALDDVSGKDLVIEIDSAGKADEWIASISKKNLVSLNPDFDLNKLVSKVTPYQIILRQSNLITEKIPVLVLQPIGEAPKGYQFLDVWPYHLWLTVNGPEDSVKKLKAKGLTITFNLNDISRSELDTLSASNQGLVDEVSYFIPNSWKKISIPQFSDTPIEIDDPQAKALRIDFSRQDLLPLAGSIPISVFFPPKFSNTLNPETYQLAANDFIVKRNGIKMVAVPLYAQGVSRLFLETVKDMIQVMIIASPKTERETLLWSAQFMYPHELEDRYVAKVLSQSNDELGDVQPHLREDYLRNRFRSYMNRFRLYTPNHKKLSLKIELQANTITVTPLNLN